MDLNTLWFILIAFLYSGYFILEGFDIGVGILLPFLSNDDLKRRVIINTIGPHWDGNEVWLIAAGGASFAVFPEWYATLLSGFYLPFFLMLMALIVRGVAFEFRSKEESTIWRSFWDWSICIGSLIPALLWGIALTNIISGVPIDGSFNYVGGFLNLLHPLALLGGLLTVISFSLHGALFLNLKTTDDLLDTSQRVAVKMWFPLLIILLGYIVLAIFQTEIFTSLYTAPVICVILIILSVLAVGFLIRSKLDKMAFILSFLTVLLASGTIFLGLYPRLMVSSLDPAWSLTIYNSSSSPYTLRVMSIIAAIFIPLVLAIQGWSYWIFRKRVSANIESLEY